MFAVDCEQKPYDIEIQRADEGAGARRARYNSAMMDADETVTGMDTENLPESYVIFITENDIYGKSQPLYKIERYIDGAVPFNDGSHIIYVNGKYRGNDPIGDLMHDFSCKKSEDMKNSVLADKVRRMKETEQGITKMCRIMEEFAREEREEMQIETAEEMLKEGSLPLEKIAQFSKLPLWLLRQSLYKFSKNSDSSGLHDFKVFIMCAKTVSSTISIGSGKYFSPLPRYISFVI